MFLNICARVSCLFGVVVFAALKPVVVLASDTGEVNAGNPVAAASVDTASMLWLAAGLTAGCLLTLCARHLLNRIGATPSFLLGAVASVSLTGLAAQVNLPLLFNGQVADAAQINANFNTLRVESNAQDLRINDLQLTAARIPVDRFEIADSAINSDKIANSGVNGIDIATSAFQVTTTAAAVARGFAPVTATDLGPAARRMCFLVGFRVSEVDSGDEFGDCQVNYTVGAAPFRWQVEAKVRSGEDNEVVCSARCYTW